MATKARGCPDCKFINELLSPVCDDCRNFCNWEPEESQTQEPESL